MRHGTPGTQCGGAMPRRDRHTKSDGDAPRGTQSGGSMPRTIRGADMARSDGGTPRTTHSDASTAHTDGGKRGGKERHTEAKVPSPIPESSNCATSRELLPSTKALTDSEHAFATRRARLRREASVAVKECSAAELVRERFSKPSKTLAATRNEQGGSSASAKRSNARNTQRLRAADASDAAVIGESIPVRLCSFTDGRESSFLSSEAKSFFPDPLQGPDDSFAPPTWFLKAVRGICRTTTKMPSKPPIMFELGELAASHTPRVRV
jgi:hypothetical protein